MFQYRISKYDPSFRDAEGRYTRDEWIMAGQIGESFDGVVLTREEYQRVEDAYVTVARGFLRESGVASLTVMGLENCAPDRSRSAKEAHWTWSDWSR